MGKKFTKEEMYGKDLSEFFSYIEKKISGLENNVPLMHAKLLEAKIEMLESNYDRLASRNIHLNERELELASEIKRTAKEKRTSLVEHIKWMEEEGEKSKP